MDCEYYGNNEARKSAFEIMNTVKKMFKYGVKDSYRIQHQILLEKYEDEQGDIDKLKTQ